MFQRGSERGRGRGRGDALPILGGGRGDGGPLSQSHSARGSGRSRGGPVQVQVFSHGPNDSPKPNLQVLSVEADIERALDGKHLSGPEMLGTGRTMPQRPGYGTQGNKILLWANYFAMEAPKDLLLFRYSIELLYDRSKGAPVGKKLKRIVELLLEEHFSAYQNLIATDFKSNLICKAVLPIPKDIYRVDYRAEGEDEPAPDAKSYQLRLRSTGTVRISELLDYLTSTHASALLDSKDEIIQALNIVVGHYPKSASHIFSIGANKHFPLHPAASETWSLGAGLHAIRGFFISVRAATSRTLLNVQVKHAACYSEGPLTRSMYAFSNANNHDLDRLENFFKKVRISVTHIVKKNKCGDNILRVKTISALARLDDGQDLEHPPLVSRFGAGAKEVRFFLDQPARYATGREGSMTGTDGKMGNKKAMAGLEPPKVGYISVHDFFERTYGIVAGDSDLPVVNVGTPEKPSYLPADVCEVLPGQRCRSNLSTSQAQLMIRYAVRKPAQNAQSIVLEGLQVSGIHPPSNTLNTFGLTVLPRLITVPGRVLPGPKVKYGGGKIANTRFGGWNMQLNQFSTKTALPYWTYLWISIEGSRDAWNSQEELAHTLDLFTAKLKEVGIGAADCTPGLQIKSHPKGIGMRIDGAIQAFTHHKSRPPPTLLLVIMPFIDASIYNRIKFLCDIKEGLRNVCVIGSRFAADRNDQYFANVALKVNLKLGGRNQFLDDPKLGVISECKTIVIGIDVTHPSPGSPEGTPSVAGIVASVDQRLGQWPADFKIQKARQEMVSGLDEMLKPRIQLWAKHNNQRYPENIIVYRDGVSEGQYESVLGNELPLLRKACREVYPANDTKKGIPRISIIIVGKRHHTRFYPTRAADADRSSNPQNGTVVDRGVTEARNWDFFLQAHAAIQGTARPAHYYVIHDEIFRGHRKAQKAPAFNNAADALEDLTHNICYLYGRATKAVSVCPPAYYADLVCERARCYLSTLFDSTSETSPAENVAEGGGGVQGADPGGMRIHRNVQDTMFYI